MTIQYIEDPETKERIPFEWNKEEPPTDKDIHALFKTIKVSKQENVVKDPSLIKQHISNIPSSFYEVGKSMVSPQTLKGVYEVAKSSIPGGRLIKWLTEGKNPTQQVIEESKPIYDAIMDRYGSWEKAKKTFAQKPGEFWMDVSGILSGGGSVVSRIPQMGKIGQVISKVGQFADPFATTGKAVGAVASKLKTPISGTLGISTGLGKGSAEKMIEGSPAFTKAMRGKVAGQEIVDTSKSGVYAIKAERGNQYRQRLQQIETMPNPPVMDIAPIKKNYNDWLAKYRIQRTPGGELDFSKSTLRGDPRSVVDFKRMDEIITDWENTPGTRTPVDFDSLKRQFDNFYSESHLSRAAIGSIRDNVKKQLVQKVPEYGTMVADYEKTTKLINEIERDLSIGKKGSIDTAIRKLNQAMREDDDFRRSLITHVEQASGQDIQSLIAGRMANVWFPKSWMGREIAVGSVMAGILGNPAILPAIATASPRLMGETFSLLAKGKRAGKKIKSTGVVSQPSRQLLYQTGRIQEGDQP